MKTIKFLLSVAAAGVVFSACNDLNQAPNTSYVTTDQKKDVVASNPEMAAATVNALPDRANTYLALFRGNPRIDTDYGVPSIFMIMDHRGMDMTSNESDYQWYTAAMEMSDFGGRYYDNIIYWRTFYNIINTSNSVLGLIDKDTDNAESQYFLGQSFGFRAWAYLYLAQMYQFTYARDAEAPCVPVLTDVNLDECAANGCPRSSVKATLEQVISDCDAAIMQLDKAQSQKVTRETMGTITNTKTFVNQAILYGLKTRALLLMQDYPNAKIAVDKAIELAKANGARPYTQDEVSKPAFYQLTDPSFLWGSYVDPSASLAGLIGWGGQMITWHPNGYPGAGCYRKINKKLYAQIPSTDVRKGWWLDANGSPSAGMPSNYKEYLSPAAAAQYGIEVAPPFTNTKFGAYADEPGATVNAEDIPYMRFEELLLMQAEAYGGVAVADGVTKLSEFVKSWRMPTYSLTASSKEAFMDEIWFQRRIELWGEGFSYHDMMRFQKTLDRVGGGFPETLVYVVAPDNPVLLYEIIQQEAENNPLIGNVANGAVKPDAVADED